MEADLEPPNPTPYHHTLSRPSTSPTHHHHHHHSNCSTPYVSAPTTPALFPPAGVGFFYSAPSSPMHYVLATAPSAALAPATSDASSSAGSFEFELSSRFNSPAPEIPPSTMSTADELFLNGQIRPMKLSAHLQRPQSLAPLIDEENDEVFQVRCKERLRDRSQRRRTRSLSPLRCTAPFDWFSDDAVPTTTEAAVEERENVKEERESETTPSESANSSRCSSAGRSSKRWVFLKDFLRSKSEGRSNNKFWHNISFSPAKEKIKGREKANAASFLAAETMRKPSSSPANRRSAHEMHYTAKRAQAEEMRKKTYLPYRQCLLGCLGFNSKSYGALNGFARALNPVSSR